MNLIKYTTVNEELLVHTKENIMLGMLKNNDVDYIHFRLTIKEIDSKHLKRLPQQISKLDLTFWQI